MRLLLDGKYVDREHNGFPLVAKMTGRPRELGVINNCRPRHDCELFLVCVNFVALDNLHWGSRFLPQLRQGTVGLCHVGTTSTESELTNRVPGP